MICDGLSKSFFFIIFLLIMFHEIGARTSGVRKVIPFLKSFAIFIGFGPQLFKRNLYLVDSAVDVPKLIHWIGG